MNKQKAEINELISMVLQELKKAQYSEHRIEKFIPTWKKLQEYMIRKNLQIFDANISLDFLEDEYGITLFKKLPRNLAICARAVNVLTDYQQHGMIQIGRAHV